MSVEWNLVCKSHNPELIASEDEQGRAGQWDLLNALVHRADIQSIPAWIWEEYGYDLPSHIRWVRFHRGCDLILRGDNGEEYWPADIVDKGRDVRYDWEARGIAR